MENREDENTASEIKKMWKKYEQAYRLYYHAEDINEENVVKQWLVNFRTWEKYNPTIEKTIRKKVEVEAEEARSTPMASTSTSVDEDESVIPSPTHLPPKPPPHEAIDVMAEIREEMEEAEEKLKEWRAKANVSKDKEFCNNMAKSMARHISSLKLVTLSIA